MKQTNSKSRSKAKAKTNQGHHHNLRWLLAALIAVVLIVGGWAGWQYWQSHRLRVAQNTVTSKFKNIHLETDSYQNDFLHAYVAYVKTENNTITADIRSQVDSRFLPCKNAGQRNTAKPAYECNASPVIDFATDDYLELTYTFRTFQGGDPTKDTQQRRVGLLYNRKTSQRYGIADLFKPAAQFAPVLSELSRQALNRQYSDLYSANTGIQAAMVAATQASPENFNDFLLGTDETLNIVFEPGEVAPTSEGPVQIAVPTNKLYDLFNQTTIDVFLPKLKEQREVAARLADAAAEARKRAQELVGANRDNIDCTKMKCIALTYDDGPYAPNGDRLLQILQERNAVATFCMVGNRVANYAAEVKQVVNQQNEICNHSWDHSDLTTLSDAQVDAQMQQTNQAIYNASGVYPKLMRPPYGAVNSRVIADISMPLAMWSVDTLDWRDRNADIVYQRAIAGAKPGAVILMHEIHPTTIDAAARIIDELQRQGYVLVTMSELFGITKDNLSQFTGKELFSL